MRFDVISIFPDLFTGYLDGGVVGQAVRSGKIEFSVTNPRKFTKDVHQTVDDRPFGGGDGMLMKVEPLSQAIEKVLAKSVERRVIYTSPSGTTWSDSMARRWAAEKKDLVLICGRYGGIDQRIIHRYVDEEISIGDYVLSGGELAALVILDSVARFLEGVIGNEASPENDSFAHGLLEAPHFTRPREFSGLAVPEVLLGGDHKKIDLFKRSVSVVLTHLRRPDLVAGQDPAVLKKAKQVLRGYSQKEIELCGIPWDFLSQ